jgi:hypothetical protein
MSQYRCVHCGWNKEAHSIIQLPWLQLPLFNNPFLKRRGYKKTLAECEEYKESREEMRERSRHINHYVPCIFIYAGGYSKIVDIGS